MQPHFDLIIYPQRNWWRNTRAPSCALGQEHFADGAGGWLPREPENWIAQEVFVKNRYVPSDLIARGPSRCTRCTGHAGEDSTEPPASAPYFYPAVSHEPRIQQLHDDLAKLGYRPFHSPSGIQVMVPAEACLSRIAASMRGFRVAGRVVEEGRHT